MSVVFGSNPTTQFRWIVAVWAAVVAPIATPACCRSCDRPCCGGSAGGGVVAVDSDPDDARGCPLCAAPAESVKHCQPDAADQPCRCQFDSREAQPLSTSRGTPPAVDQDAQAALPAAADIAVPRALGVSREYLAASLAVSIRPARILFGVWRD